MAGPDSSYSALEIHIDWKVESDERMDTQINLQAAKAGLERPVDFQAMDFCTHAY